MTIKRCPVCACTPTKATVLCPRCYSTMSQWKLVQSCAVCNGLAVAGICKCNLPTELAVWLESNIPGQYCGRKFFP